MTFIYLFVKAFAKKRLNTLFAFPDKLSK